MASKKEEKTKVKKVKKVDYNKWGYFFIAPFFIIFTIFSLIPLISTFVNSLYENYRVGLMTIGPDFIGLENFKSIFALKLCLR